MGSMKILVIDADYTYDKENNPIIRIYGKEIVSGEDIVVHVRGFEPYFYVDNCGFDVVELKEMILKEFKGYIKRIEIVKKYRPIGYQEKKIDMLRIVLWNPRVTRDLRKLITEKLGIDDDKIYEADILFRDRFLTDTGIDGMGIIWFNQMDKEQENYGLGCNKLYIVDINDIGSVKEQVRIDY